MTVGHNRIGRNIRESIRPRRSFRAFWGERAWRRDGPDVAGPIRVPAFGIELSLDEVYAGVDFDCGGTDER
jgi:hypothetical protein